MRPILTSALVCFWLAILPQPVQADQKDPRLDKLFGQLQQVSSPVEANLVEAQIWTVWLETDSDTINLLMQRALEAMSLNKFQASLETLSSIVKIAPDFAEGWNKRATVLYLMDRHEESIQDVEKTLVLEPRHFGALSGLGLIYNQLGDEAKALDAFERALAVNPHIPLAQSEVKRLKKKIKGEKI